MTLGFAGVTPDFAFLAIDDSLISQGTSQGQQMKLWHAGRLGWACCAGSPGAGLSTLSALFVAQKPQVATRIAYPGEVRDCLGSLMRAIWKGSDQGLRETQGEDADPNRITRLALVGPHLDGFHWWLQADLDDDNENYSVELMAGRVEGPHENFATTIGILPQEEQKGLAQRLQSELGGSPEEAVEAAINLLQQQADTEAKSGTYSVSSSGHVALHHSSRWRLLRFGKSGEKKEVRQLFDTQRP